MSCFNARLKSQEEGGWFVISAPLAFRDLAPDYFSLQELFPSLTSEAKWTKVDTYRDLGLRVEFHKKANWTYLGVPVDDPAFVSPKAFYKASIDGIQGLDYDVPDHVMTSSQRQALDYRIARTPMSMNAKLYKGVTFPSTLRSGLKRPQPASSSSASASSASASSDSDDSPPPPPLRLLRLRLRHRRPPPSFRRSPHSHHQHARRRPYPRRSPSFRDSPYPLHVQAELLPLQLAQQQATILGEDSRTGCMRQAPSIPSLQTPHA